ARRAGRRSTVVIRVGRRPRGGAAGEDPGAGSHVQELTPNLIRENRLSVDHGAFVHFVERGSPASEAGLLVGDVVERIEAPPVTSLDDLRAAMGEARRKPRFLVVARPGAETQSVLLKWGPGVPGAADAAKPGPAALPAPESR